MSIGPHAVRLAQKQIPVFELARGEKCPPQGSRWANGGATIDPLEAAERFFASDHNLGARLDGRLVLDVDPRNGGDETFAALPKLPTTYKVRTAGGGFHLYFRLPEGVSISGGAGKLGSGVDIKTGPAAYVVGAGSTVNGGHYTVENDAPEALCPEWILARLAAARAKAPDAGKVVGGLDTDAAVAKAVAYLRAAAPAIEQQGGDDTTYKTACAVLDFGVSPETCLELMLEHYNPRCNPDWSEAELKRKVANAAEYRQAAIGRDNPAAGFEAVCLPQEAKLFVSAARWNGVQPTPAPFVIGTYVPEGYVTIVGAAGGRGKSSFTLQMMICTAAGRDFLGCKVSGGAAAAIFCEDADEQIHERAKAICRALGVDFTAVSGRLFPTSFLNRPAVLWKEKSGRTELLARVEQAIASIPNLKLLIIDGSADTFAASEIDRNEVSKFMAELTRLASRFGIAIVLVMHESKSTADDDIFAFSGTTAWFNKCRSAIKIALVEDHDNKRRLLHLKCNLGPKARPAVCAFENFAFSRLADDEDRAADCFDLTRELMARGVTAGEQLSPNKRASNFAGRWLEENQGDGSDFHKDEFAAQLTAPAKLGLGIEIYKTSGGRKAQRFIIPPVGVGSPPGVGWCRSVSVPKSTDT